MAYIKGNEQPVMFMTNPLFTTPIGDKVPEQVNMLVEIPKGSYNKYEYVTNTGVLKLDRVIYEQISYPVEYGLIPQTWDEDEDMLDIMSLITVPTFPGCLINVRPIGFMKFIDCGQIDDKIIAVPVDDVRFKNIQDIKDIEQHKLDEIAFFFQYYKNLQFKYRGQKNQKVEFQGWGNKKKAHEIIQKAIERYKGKFQVPTGVR